MERALAAKANYGNIYLFCSIIIKDIFMKPILCIESVTEKIIKANIKADDGSIAELILQEYCDNEQDDEYFVMNCAVSVGGNVYRVTAKNCSI